VLLSLASLPALVTPALAPVPLHGQRVGSAAGPGPEVRGADGAAATITAADLRARVAALAHDSMRGRDTPSPELEETARYVAEHFRAFGLEPALGDSFLQPYPVTVVEPGDPGRQRIRLSGPHGSTVLRPGSEFVAAPTAPSARAEGPIRVWAPGRAPPSEPGILAVRAGPADLGRVFARVREVLAGDGADGALVAVTGSPAFFDRVRDFFGARQVNLGEPDALTKPVVVVPLGSLPDGLADPLGRGAAPEAGWRASLHTEAEVRGERAWNTIGWIPGSDPALRNEYVVFSAHMDHVGVGRPVDGDSIYNGADDDASGTAAVLELAEAFAARERPPRRSVVFLTVSGEEKGLLGSRWYVEQPVFPLDRTVANVNIDMIGRNWRDTVVAIGRGLSSLGETLDAVAAARSDLGLTVVDDPWPEERFFLRSDHYNFARGGVPALFFFSGVHEDYHRPGDESGKLDYAKTARIARLIYHLGVEVAEADSRPEWDPEAYERVVEEGGSR